MKKIIETKIDRKDLESIFELKKRLKQEFPDVGIPFQQKQCHFTGT